MTWPSGYWHTLFLNNDIVDYLSDLLDKNDVYDTNNLTINGLQSFNVVDKVDVGKIEIPMALSVSNSCPEALDIPFETHHIHLIEYNSNGYQLPHDHSRTEDFSFIIYLNDSDQKTVFYRNEYMYVTPEKGKMIVFDSSLLHWSLPGKNKKRVAVGAVRYLK